MTVMLGTRIGAIEVDRGGRRPFGRPSPRRLIGLVALVAALAAVSTVASTLAYLRLPAPTGESAIGRQAAVWTDPTRPETHTPAAADLRQLRVVAWYPTDDAASAAAPYLADLDAIRDGLVASGELSAVEVAGLGFASANAHADAPPSAAETGWPVLLLSPGNATNVEFYGAIAEELASHGYVVLGIDHPWQVAAVALADGQVAVLEPEAAPTGPIGAQDGGPVVAKIAERVADIGFVVDRLVAGDLPGLEGLTGRLDLDRIGILGHSNGGIAAVQACKADPRLDACLNIDGQLAAGPFGASGEPVAPDQPFLVLTKEATLHPRLAEAFEAGGDGTYRVVVPAAGHEQFADGPRFEPRLLPVEGTADAVLRVSRGFAVAFFDHVLRGAPRSVLGEVDAPTDVRVEVYPLQPRS